MYERERCINSEGYKNCYRIGRTLTYVPDHERRERNAAPPPQIHPARLSPFARLHHPQVFRGPDRLQRRQRDHCSRGKRDAGEQELRGRYENRDSCLVCPLGSATHASLLEQMSNVGDMFVSPRPHNP